MPRDYSIGKTRVGNIWESSQKANLIGSKMPERKYEGNGGLLPHDLPVTFGQLRHASSIQHKKKMYRRVTGDARDERFTGI
jgi:hypothetical protein